MKKTLLLFILPLLAAASIYSQSAPAASQKPYRLLWEIKGPHSPQPSYLFGTMHVTDERAFHMPDSVLLAIQNTPGFALEVDFDSASYLYLEYMYAKRGQAVFEENVRTTKTRVTQDDAPGTNFDPSDLFKLFEREGQHKDEATFLDAFLYRTARSQGKTISGLEGLVEQLQLIGDPDMSDEDGPKTSKPRGRRPRLEEMIEVYERGDLDALDQMVNKNALTSDFFKQKVIIQRNYGMARRADSLMQHRPTFIGVGSAHLPGNEGLIALLTARGYTLRPVVATYTGLADSARAKPYQPRWSTFQRNCDGYRLKVPARPFPLEFLDGQLKMYLGMDFPGGFVYCFYSLKLPTEMSDERFEEVGKTLASTFARGKTADFETESITYKGLKGKEFRVQKDQEALRIRLLLRDGRMYMLLLGNSPKVTASAAADEWFNSLEFFEPVSIMDQPRPLLIDHVNGFSMEMPMDYDYLSHQVDGFPDDGDEPLYNQYEIKDGEHFQKLRVLSEDFRGPSALGTLRNRMPECILYLADQQLEPRGEFRPLLTDSIMGYAAVYDSDDLRYRLHAYLRLNRLYVFGIAMKPDDPDSTAAEAILNSIHFLEYAPWKLSYTHVVDSAFSVALPGKPITWKMEDLADEFMGRIDSIDVTYFHDPVSSLNITIEHAHVWKHYAGSNRELFALASDLKSYPKAALQFRPEAGWDADTTAARIGGACSNRVVMPEKHIISALECISVGEDVLFAKIQVPNTATGDALITEFRSHLTSLAKPAAQKLRQPKLVQLLLDIDSQDSLIADEARSAMMFYHLQPSEYQLALDEALKKGDGIAPDDWDYLMDMLMRVDDPAILPGLQDFESKLPADAPQRSQVLYNVLNRNWPGANDWALSRFKAAPGCLAYASPFFSWSSYLRKDSTGALLRGLRFLLDEPGARYLLASDAAANARIDSLPYAAFADQFARILQAELQQGTKEKDYDFALNAYHLLAFIAEENANGWQEIAHDIIAHQDGYLPGSALLLLNENGTFASTKELKRVLEMRSSRDFVMDWYLDMGHGDKIPAKYRRPDFIAEVALDLALEDHPEKLELVEKRKIYWNDAEQWFYIYRFAFEGDRDWTLGFSGPVPLKGLPESAYLELSGSDYEDYSPATYKKKVRTWLREASDE